MTLSDAISLIRPAIQKPYDTWADIGAGTGMFTQALIDILSSFAEASADGAGNRGSGEKGGSRIYAVDKSPHALWALKSNSQVEVIVVEADFNKPLDLPLLDGIVMANALHYAQDHLETLKNIISSLKINGIFILVEYDAETARTPWVPYPVSFTMFENLCVHAGLSAPSLIGKMHSVYGSDRIYSATARKQA